MSRNMRRSEVHAADSVTCLNRALTRLKDIWEEIGIPEDQRYQRTDVVKKHIKTLLDMMIAEEENLRQRLVTSIETCQKELNTLSLELHLPPFEEEEGSTMLQREKDLRTRLAILMKQKTQRIQELKGLVLQDEELCDIMRLTPYSIDVNLVPTLDQLNDYRAHLEGLTKEKVRRQEEFVDIKKQITVCMAELDHLPDTSFEREVVCEDEEAFCLSDDNIENLKVLLNQLKERKAQNELQCSVYRNKIEELWERLQIPREEREAIAEHMVNSKKANMAALQAEAERLDVLKMENLQNVIEAIRAEVALLWEKCCYSLQQRQAFAPYYHDILSEELLGLHEAEVLHLKKYYEEHLELFEGVRRWQENWTLFLELEKKATDPSRFNNRGGNLLKEEKQRIDLQKSLPKLEKSLKSQIDLWEEKQGKEFLVNGTKFLDYVQQQWDLRQQEKELEKQERQLKKTKQIEVEMLYGTPARTPSKTPLKRHLAATPTPGKTRKINVTSSISSSGSNTTLRSVFSGSICQSPVPRPPLSASKYGLGLRTPGSVKKTPRHLDRNKENISQLGGVRGVLRPLNSPHHDISINSVASTYSEFARDLSDTKSNMKTRLNSTVTHL